METETLLVQKNKTIQKTQQGICTRMIYSVCQQGKNLSGSSSSFENLSVNLDTLILTQNSEKT